MYHLWHAVHNQKNNLRRKLLFVILSIIFFSIVYMFFDDKEFSGLFQHVQRKSAVENYFDRLYYSTIIQTSIGIGDIFPSSKKVRFVTMIQALITIIILLS